MDMPTIIPSADHSAAFIDPFFSSGVHLAMTGALSAAASIAASIHGDCTETEAADYHNARVSLSYTRWPHFLHTTVQLLNMIVSSRFLIVVLSAYKQIRAQSTNVLLDIEEKNFDKAFACIRPRTYLVARHPMRTSDSCHIVIQGGADMGKRLTEDEVQRALDFCVHLFDPTTPEQHESARRQLEAVYGMSAAYPSPTSSPSLSTAATARTGYGSDCTSGAAEHDVSHLFDVRGPVVDPAQLDKLLQLQLRLQDPRTPQTPTPPPSPRVPPVPSSPGCASAEIRMVLDKVNARRVIHAEHGDALNNLEEEALGGLVPRLTRGALGLRRVNASSEVTPLSSQQTAVGKGTV